MGAHRFKFERELLKRGLVRIAGVDEAGRGPLAGPVVAAAVCFPIDWIEKGLPRKLRGLNDSKQVPLEEREKFFNFLTSEPAIRYASAVVAVEVIDSINILQASHRAMNEAIARLQPAPDHCLIDGLHMSSLRPPQTALVDGDARSYSIAAASIIAKVTRDRLMADYDKLFPSYGFALHKGYGTPQHLNALAQHGPCSIHRRSFSPIRQSEPELFNL
jgi:ribonuclease HII